MAIDVAPSSDLTHAEAIRDLVVVAAQMSPDRLQEIERTLYYSSYRGYVDEALMASRTLTEQAQRLRRWLTSAAAQAIAQLPEPGERHAGVITEAILPAASLLLVRDAPPDDADRTASAAAYREMIGPFGDFRQR